MNNEKPKRLAPKPETLRELFLKSGNLCAFPNCSALMMDAQGVFIGQLCHIEAAEEGGQRFNPDMTNEDRRAAANLMLMCYEHHTVTNDVDQYPTERLREMKADHDRRFSSPDRAILERLTDWTTTESPREVQSLHRLKEVLGWEIEGIQLDQAVAELNEYIEILRRVPHDVRRFMGAVARRMYRMSDTGVVKDGMSAVGISVSDFKSAHRMSDTAIRDKITQLETYGLGGLGEIDTNLGVEYAIEIGHLNSGWPLWLDLVEFCELTDTPIERFTVDLDFSCLDDES